MKKLKYHVFLAYSPCDINPCQNGGICTNLANGVSCDCPDYFTGELCEIQELITPTLPILDVFVQSQLLYINTTTTHTNTITITLIISGNVDFSPSNELQIVPGEKSVAFHMTPLQSGSFVLEYDVQTTSTLAKPDNDYLIVYPRNNTNYFASNGLDDVIAPGCCSRNTSFDLSYCKGTNRQVSLSSSCGWGSSSETTFRTEGLTFIHSGGVALPLSIISLDATLSSSILDLAPADSGSSCRSCVDMVLGNETCYDWDLNIEDTKDMIQSGSLLRTLIHRMSGLLPTTVSITNAIDFHSEPNGYMAILTDAATLRSLPGCGSLSKSLDGLMYAVRSHSDITVNVNGDHISYSNNLDRNPFCFAVSICHLPQSPLHISLPNQANNDFTKLSAFTTYLEADWSITVSSTSLSYYGFDAFDEEWFWNGTHLISLNVPYYDVSLWMSVQGSMSLVDHVVEFSFMGSMFSLIGYDEEV